MSNEQRIKIKPEIRVVTGLEQKMAASSRHALEHVVRHSSRRFGGDRVLKLVRMLSLGDYDRHATGETF